MLYGELPGKTLNVFHDARCPEYSLLVFRIRDFQAGDLSDYHRGGIRPFPLVAVLETLLLQPHVGALSYPSRDSISNTRVNQSPAVETSASAN